jgi:hypothetical protein
LVQFFSFLLVKSGAATTKFPITRLNPAVETNSPSPKGSKIFKKIQFLRYIM